ncbi:hypothetical protein EDC94DRAFT_626364, partial [Helicostylum pulchrum]
MHMILASSFIIFAWISLFILVYTLTAACCTQSLCMILLTCSIKARSIFPHLFKRSTGIRSRESRKIIGKIKEKVSKTRYIHTHI